MEKKGGLVYGQVKRLILVSHTLSNHNWSNTHGYSDSDQTAGRRELDETPAVTAGSTPQVDEDLMFEDDGPWYMGKARDQFNRRMRDAAVPGDDEDPVQVHDLSGCLSFPY